MEVERFDQPGPHGSSQPASAPAYNVLCGFHHNSRHNDHNDKLGKLSAG